MAKLEILDPGAVAIAPFGRLELPLRPLARATHRHIVAPLTRPLSSWLIRSHLRAALDGAQTVIDVAVGDDPFALELAVAGKTVVVNDVDLEALAYLKKSADAKGLSVRFVQSDVRHLPLDGPFDAVLMKNLCHHLENLDDVRTVLRTLASTGRRILLLEIEDPRRSHVARVWNGYYRIFLGDKGFNFIDRGTFVALAHELSPSAVIRTIRTIKGNYMFSTLDV